MSRLLTHWNSIPGKPGFKTIGGQSIFGSGDIPAGGIPYSGATQSLNMGLYDVQATRFRFGSGPYLDESLGTIRARTPDGLNAPFSASTFIGENLSLSGDASANSINAQVFYQNGVSLPALYAQLSGGNTFTGNQNVTGNITASGNITTNTIQSTSGNIAISPFTGIVQLGGQVATGASVGGVIVDNIRGFVFSQFTNNVVNGFEFGLFRTGTNTAALATTQAATTKTNLELNNLTASGYVTTGSKITLGGSGFLPFVLEQFTDPNNGTTSAMCIYSTTNNRRMYLGKPGTSNVILNLSAVSSIENAPPLNTSDGTMFGGITGSFGVGRSLDDLYISASAPTTGDIIIRANNAGYGTQLERMRLKGATGNLLIGTTTDGGSSKLQVNGNITASGNLSLSTLNSSQLIFGTSGNTNITTQASGFLLYNAPNGGGSATHYFRENGLAYLQIAGGALEVQGTRAYTFSSGGASSGDIALYRKDANTLQINNRTLGGVRSLEAKAGGTRFINSLNGTHGIEMHEVHLDSRTQLRHSNQTSNYIQFSHAGPGAINYWNLSLCTLGADTRWGTGGSGNSNNIVMYQSSASGADATVGLYVERYADSTVNGQPRFNLYAKRIGFHTKSADSGVLGTTVEQAYIDTNGLTVSNNISATGFVTSAFRSLSADPTTLDITSGSSQLVKNTTSGEIRHWVNDGGVMKKSAALT